MNILYLTPDHSTASFGVTTVVSQLADRLTFKNSDLSLIISAVGTSAVKQNDNVIIKLIQPSRVGAAWRWTPNIKNKIKSVIKEFKIDIVHIHGIWRAIHWAGLDVARANNIPTIISPHGMLEPWLWNSQGLAKRVKKELYTKFIFNPAIPKTYYFHAITPLEKKNLQIQYPLSKIFTIPNAINIPISSSGNKRLPIKQILFLGRLHPKKGIDILLKAFAEIQKKDDWKLIIAGPEDYPNYLHTLKKNIQWLNIEDYVEFKGAIWGDQKQELIESSWVMIAPSFSEVIGMVNLEAAAYRTPSITTYQTGLADWQEGGGKLINPTTFELKQALSEVMAWTLETRISQGDASFEHVKQNYSWEVILPKWQKLYKEIRSKNE